jgi:hypothetical protein
LVLLASLGCEQQPPPRIAWPDAKVVEDLENYGLYPAKYKLNADGHVTEIKLEGFTFNDAALAKACRLPELKMMSLFNSSVTDDGLEKLRDCESLEAIGLGKTKVTREGLKHLENLPRLRWVWLNVSEDLSAKDIEDFKVKAGPRITVYK